MYVVTLQLLAECNHLGAGHWASCKLQERKVGKSTHLSLIIYHLPSCPWHAGTPTITEAEKKTVSTVLEQLLSGYASD